MGPPSTPGILVTRDAGFCEDRPTGQSWRRQPMASWLVPAFSCIYWDHARSPKKLPLAEREYPHLPHLLIINTVRKVRLHHDTRFRLIAVRHCFPFSVILSVSRLLIPCDTPPSSIDRRKPCHLSLRLKTLVGVLLFFWTPPTRSAPPFPQRGCSNSSRSTLLHS